jgi:hypothetical protein
LPRLEAGTDRVELDGNIDNYVVLVPCLRALQRDGKSPGADAVPRVSV